MGRARRRAQQQTRLNTSGCSTCRGLGAGRRQAPAPRTRAATACRRPPGRKPAPAPTDDLVVLQAARAKDLVRLRAAVAAAGGTSVSDAGCRGRRRSPRQRATRTTPPCGSAAAHVRDVGLVPVVAVAGGSRNEHRPQVACVRGEAGGREAGRWAAQLQAGAAAAVGALRDAFRGCTQRPCSSSTTGTGRGRAQRSAWLLAPSESAP